MAFFIFSTTTMLLGITGVIFNLFSFKQISKICVNIAWFLTSIIMILCLVTGIFLSIGVEVLIDSCRVVSKGLTD